MLTRLGLLDSPMADRLVRIVGLSETRALSIEEALAKDPFIPGHQWRGLHHQVESEESIILFGEIDADDPENLSGVAVGAVKGLVACPDPWVQRGLQHGWLTMDGSTRGLLDQSGVISAVHVEPPARRRGVGLRLMRAMVAELRRRKMIEAIAMRSLQKRFAPAGAQPQTEKTLGDRLYAEKVLERLGFSVAGIASLSDLPRIVRPSGAMSAVRSVMDRLGYSEAQLAQLSVPGKKSGNPNDDFVRVALQPLMALLGVSLGDLQSDRLMNADRDLLHQLYLELHSNPSRFEIWTCALVAKPAYGAVETVSLGARAPRVG